MLEKAILEMDILFIHLKDENWNCHIRYNVSILKKGIGWDMLNLVSQI